MQNADFGQILARARSRDTDGPMQTWYQKMRKTWKKKVIKSVSRFETQFRAGGGQYWQPSPPVKIGLKHPPPCTPGESVLW